MMQASQTEKTQSRRSREVRQAITTTTTEKTDKPAFTHSFSSARAEALLARMRPIITEPSNLVSSPNRQSSASAHGSPTMYTTMTGFHSTAGAGSPTVKSAHVSETLVGQVRVLVEQISGAHQGPSHRARRTRLTQELLSGCAALGFTPSMVLAGVPTILEQFALATVEEKPVTSTTTAADTSLTTTQAVPSAACASAKPAAVPASTTTDTVVAAERLLPPLIDHVQLMTEDGLDAMAMETYMATTGAANNNNNNTNSNSQTVTGRGVPINAEGTARGEGGEQALALRPEASAADVLVALLELCGKPLTYLTLQDQQCLPLAVEALALSCSLIATRLDMSVILLDEQLHGHDASSVSREMMKPDVLKAHVRVLRRVRMAALAALESLLRPFAQGAGATTAARDGAGDPSASPFSFTGTGVNPTPSGASRRRRDRPSTGQKPVFNIAKSVASARAISVSTKPTAAAANSTHRTLPLAAAAEGPTSSPVYEATVVAATLSAMDAQGFVSALSGPLLERWAMILKEAAVISTVTAESAETPDATSARLPSSRTTRAQGVENPKNSEEEDARELVVVSFIEYLRLDSAHALHHTTPENDFSASGRDNNKKNGDATTAHGQTNNNNNNNHRGGSSSDDDEDEGNHRHGQNKTATTGGPHTPSSAESSTAAAHARLVLSRREEDEITHLLRIFGHLFVILDQRVQRDEAWLKLTAAPNRGMTAATVAADRTERGLDVVLHPMIPVLAVRTLSRALPGDACASLTMDLLCWMQKRAPQILSRALLYHVGDAAMFNAVNRDYTIGVEEDDAGDDLAGDGEEEEEAGLGVVMTAALDDVVREPCALESVFDALIVQLNASHRLQQRELRNDLIVLITSVLSEDASVLRHLGLLRQSSVNKAVRGLVANTTTTGSNNNNNGDSGASRPALLLPLPPRTVDAVNAIVLTMFNLLCSPELNLAVASGVDGEGDELSRGTAAATAGVMLEMLEAQLPLLSPQTLAHYTLRFNGVASPSQRREFLQFKRLGWQLLASVCEWQAARVYFEGSHYIPRSLLATPVEKSAIHTTYDGLYLVDLCLLGFLDVLLLYVDVDCRVAVVVAWTQEELVALQDEAWQLMSSLVENAEELRQLFALDWEVFTTAVANAHTRGVLQHGLELDGGGVDEDGVATCDGRTGSLRSGSLGAAGAMVPADSDLAAALKASRRFSSAPPPRRMSVFLDNEGEQEEDENNGNDENNDAQDALATARAAENAADRARAEAEDAKGADVVARDEAVCGPVIPMPSVLKGPDVHLLEAGAVDVALRYIRVAPLTVEALKHKAVQLLDAIARSSSTTRGLTVGDGDGPVGHLTVVDGAEQKGEHSLHMSLNARLSVQKYTPTLVRAHLARTPGLVKLLVHILRELQSGGTANNNNNNNNHTVMMTSHGDGDDDDEVGGGDLAALSEASATPFSLSFLQSASSSLLALVCVHFLHSLGESAKEEVGGIHELDALHHRDQQQQQQQQQDDDDDDARRAARKARSAHRVASFLKSVSTANRVAATPNAAKMGEERVTVVDMGYGVEPPGLMTHPGLDSDGEDDDGEEDDDDDDDEEEEDVEDDDNHRRHRSRRPRSHSLKPMAAGPGGMGGLSAPLGTSFRDVMKLGYEFEDAGGVALVVTWMQQVLLPNPTEAIAIGTRLDLTGTTTANQATLLSAAAVASHPAQSRAPPLQESHLYRQLDMLIALFGVVRSLILGSEHIEQTFVKAGGVAVLLEVTEALAIAGNVLLPIPEHVDAPCATAPAKDHRERHDVSPQPQQQQQRQHMDPETSPAALARLKAALSLAMVRDPTPLAAAARGDTHMLRQRHAAFTDALRYALTLLSELLYTSERACQALLCWRSRRVEKCAVSTGGALPVKTTHDTFMNAVQLLIALWSTALSRQPQRDTSLPARADATQGCACAPNVASAGLEVLRLRVRDSASALLREEYVRRFLRAKLASLYPDEAACVLRTDEDDDDTAMRTTMMLSGGGVEGVEGHVVDATVDLLHRGIGMEELWHYYLYATGQDDGVEATAPSSPSPASSPSSPNRANADEEGDEEEPEGNADGEADGAVAWDGLQGEVVRVTVLRRRLRHRGGSSQQQDADSSSSNSVRAQLFSVLTRGEKNHILRTMAANVAITDAGSELHRQACIGRLLHRALGLGEKVYSCLASLGFEYLISHPTTGSSGTDHDAMTRSAFLAANGGSSTSTPGTTSGVMNPHEVVALSPAERSHLISIAALPALCMDELCVSMAKVASVVHSEVSSSNNNNARVAQNSSGRAVTSLSALVSPISADVRTVADGASLTADDLAQAGTTTATAATSESTVRMRPTSPDRRCLQGVLTDVYARGHEIAQLVHLGHEASETQEQQLYDRFLVTRVRQPMKVLHGNTQTLLALRDATYGPLNDVRNGNAGGGRSRGSSFRGRRHSSVYAAEAPHVVVTLSPGAASTHSRAARHNNQQQQQQQHARLSVSAPSDPGMSALATRLAARMTQTQREQEARQLLQSLSSAAPAATSAASAANKSTTSQTVAAAHEMLISSSTQYAQQFALHSTSSPTGTRGGSASAPRAPHHATHNLAGSATSASMASSSTRTPQPPPPRALVDQRKKKEAMVRNSLKRLPQQKDQKPQDASTLMVDAVFKDVNHSS